MSEDEEYDDHAAADAYAEAEEVARVAGAAALAAPGRGREQYAVRCGEGHRLGAVRSYPKIGPVLLTSSGATALRTERAYMLVITAVCSRPRCGRWYVSCRDLVDHSGSRTPVVTTSRPRTPEQTVREMRKTIEMIRREGTDFLKQ